MNNFNSVRSSGTATKSGLPGQTATHNSVSSRTAIKSGLLNQTAAHNLVMRNRVTDTQTATHVSDNVKLENSKHGQQGD